jgi:hypothetical protein
MENNATRASLEDHMLIRTSDGYLHVTKLAQAYKRRPSAWLTTSEAKALIRLHDADVGKPTSGPVLISKGGNTKFAQGTKKFHS